MLADQGDISLIGHALSQSGVLLSTTTVNTRGTIHFLTPTDGSDPTASIALAANSVTEVEPEDLGQTELDSARAANVADSLIVNANRAGSGSISKFNPQLNNHDLLPDQLGESRVEISGDGTVDIGAGALVQAQGGQIAVNGGSQVTLESGAMLDVSGTTSALLPASINSLLVNVQPFQLSESAANRTGGLKGSNVYVDARSLVEIAGGAYAGNIYTPGGLLQVGGFLGQVPHGIGELTAIGGQVTLQSQTSLSSKGSVTTSFGTIVTDPGSVINLQGGAVNYAAGAVPQSYVVTTDGVIYNVNTAPANLVYAGLYTGFTVDHPRWHVTNVFDNPLLTPATLTDPATTVGRDAGTLTLTAATEQVAGSIYAGITLGQNQTGPRPANVTDPYLLAQTVVPQSGTLLIGNYQSGILQPAPIPSPVSIGPVAAGAVPVKGSVALESSVLDASALANITLSTGGDITVSAPLAAADGGTLSLTGANIALGESLTARGGAITLTDQLAGSPVGTASSVTLAPGVVLDARGVYTNARQDPAQQAGLGHANGGTVSIITAGGVDLAAGTRIDVSSGGGYLASGAQQQAAGGSVTVEADAVVNTGTPRSAPITLDAAFVGYGTTGGGTLTVSAPDFEISTAGPNSTAGTVVSLGAAFFTAGFSRYVVDGTQALNVLPGTQVTVAEPIYVPNGLSTVPTGGDPSQAYTVTLPALYTPSRGSDVLAQRSDGASVSLLSLVNPGDATISGGGTVTIGAGASVAVDPRQSIAVAGYDQVSVFGTLTAHAGTVTVGNTRVDTYTGTPTGIGNLTASNFLAGVSDWIGAGSLLDVSGQAVVQHDPFGRRFGFVTSGGTIALGGYNPLNTAQSTWAQVIVRPGATLDADGASASVDVVPDVVEAGRISVQSDPVTLAGAGGSISARSLSGVALDGTLLAHAGDGQVAGGSLTLQIDPITLTPYNNIPAAVFQPRQVLVSNLAVAVQPADAQPGDLPPPATYGLARMSQQQIDGSGVDAVTLGSAGGAVIFDGDVSLHAARSLTFGTGIIGDTSPYGTVRIASPHVSFAGYTSSIDDQSRDLQPAEARLASFSTLAVSAGLIDIGAIVDLGGAIEVTKTPQLFAGPMTGGFGAPAYSVYTSGFGFTSAAFSSAGDIRLLGTTDSNFNKVGTLSSIGDYTFTAAQLYPTTGQSEVLLAGFNTEANVPATLGHTITVQGLGGAAPQGPYSVGGTLTLLSDTIVQNGVIRAPEGTISLSDGTVGLGGLSEPSQVILGPTSITSVSLAGQSIPYGGTVDGVIYQIPGGNPLVAFQPAVVVQSQSLDVQDGARIDISGGGTLTGQAFVFGRGGTADVLTTPLLDITGGTAVANARAQVTAIQPVRSGDQVYAILPGYQSAYAPAATAGDSPAYTATQTGEQITVAAGEVPGLAAGTYTLLPAYYALQSGGYRVELTTAPQPFGTSLATGNFTTAAPVTISFAGTSIVSPTPVGALFTSRADVGLLSQYDTEDFSTFEIAHAALIGAPRPFLPQDAKTLQLLYPSVVGANTALSIAPASLLKAPGAGGYGATLEIDELAEMQSATGTSVPAALQVVPMPGDIGAPGVVTLDAPTLSALDVPRLVLGGTLGPSSIPGALNVSSATDAVTLLPGAVLTAGEVLLTATPSGTITVSSGATVSTVGAGPTAFDVSAQRYFTNDGVSFADPVLDVSAGNIVFLPQATSALGASITIGDFSSLLATGSLNLLAPTSTTVNISGSATLGAANYATFQLAEINIGTQAALGALAGQLPSGLNLTPEALSGLLDGVPSQGIPATNQFNLTATQNVNFVGAVQLQTAATNLVLNTPAIYGVGSSGDTASILSAGFTWSGIQGAAPGGQIAAGLTGPGSDTFLVQTTGAITLGYGPQTQPNDQVQLDRTVAGFAKVELRSASEITANNKSSLSVYQNQQVIGQPGTGGTLSLIAPLVTTDSAAVLVLAAGGAVNLAAPATLAPASTAGVTTLGGEIDIAAPAVSISTAVALPSGRLSLTAAGDLSFLPGSVADLSGRTVHLLDQTIYSPGGTLVAESTAGNIELAGLADVSSPGAAAGSLSFSALAGDLDLGGTLRGAASAGQTPGSITLLSATLSTTTSVPADDVFGLINAGLNAGFLFGARSFEIGQLANGAGPGAATTPNVTIGNAADGTPLLVAQHISVTADQGAIDVIGTVDASGAGPGSIALQAAGNLVLDTAHGAPVLDAHATTTALDSYGQPIDAENRAHVTLTSTAGSLLLGGGTIDLSYLDAAGQPGTPVGELVLNAARIGAAPSTGGDVAIDASAPIAIAGAASVALYGWTHYAATDAIGSIAQSTQVDAAANVTLEAINHDNMSFIGNAGANTALTARLAGLIGSNPGTFHLRPGVEIDSSTQSGGDLTIVSDLDLAAGRYSDTGYGTQQTGVLGSGEPGSVVFRASNDLIVNGSVTDGFGAPPDIKNRIPADRGWTFGGPDRFDPLSADVILPSTIVAKIKGGGTTNTVGLAKGTTFRDGTAGTASRNVSLNYAIMIKANSITNGAIPFPATLAADIVIPAGGFVTTSSITTPTGAVVPAGTFLAANTTIAAGSSFTAGATFPSTANLPDDTLVPPGTLLSLFDSDIKLSQTAVLPVDAFIPSDTFTKFVAADGSELKSLELRPDAYHLSGNKAQGYVYALAPLLPAGSLSWNLDFVAGADMASADVNAVQSRSALAAQPQTQAAINTAYQGRGNLILDDQHYFNPPGAGGVVTPAFSVIRTGTGDLSLVAGGNFDQSSLYGIYTAGSQTTPGAGFSLPRAGTKGGELVKGGKDGAYNKIFSKDYQAYYPNDGGDVRVAAQGSVTGDEYGGNFSSNGFNLLLSSDAVGNWLWRQGSSQLGQASAWWINFGSVAIAYAAGDNVYLDSTKQLVQLVGFQGIGALGGGNVVVSAGLDAGQTTDRTGTGGSSGDNTRGEGLIVAVGSTGRVLADGTLIETGGGNVSLQVGGTINPLDAVASGITDSLSTLNGAITDLRGRVTVNAGAVGRIESAYGTAAPSDGPFTLSYMNDDALSNGGLEVNPGDGAVTISALRDVVLDGVGDPGRVTEQSLPLADVSQGGSMTRTGVATGFTLWTADTSINLFSSGGNVTPTTQPSTVTTDNSSIANDASTDFHFVYPTKLLVTAAVGDIVYGTSPSGTGYYGVPLEIAPSANEQVAFLAGQSIFAGNLAIDLSGADPTGLSTPAKPAFATFAGGANGGPLLTNILTGGGTNQSPLSVFAQEADTPTVSYLSPVAQAMPALFYAGSDIVSLTTGETETFPAGAQESLAQWYLAAKPVRIEAGRDIFASGTPLTTGVIPGSIQQNQQPFPIVATMNPTYFASGNLFLNATPQSVSVVSAGRDIINSYFYVGGPGLLEVDAGRNITATGGIGSIKSLGSLLAGAPVSLTGGAGIEVAAGLGTGADYTGFADLYLNPANQANLALQITDPANAGKVQETYATSLLAWLQANYGYTGDQAGALPYFLDTANVPAANQDAFLRDVFFNELLASGQQYNNPASRFFGSYVRGRQAIDALLPGNAGQKSAAGTPLGYAGAIALSSTQVTVGSTAYTLDSGIATEHGGDIQVLDPGGQVLLGTSGSTNPGAGTGLITNGSGNIDVFSNGSVLLGKSRIFTNAGGNIQIWSAAGDINAGVGARTDVTFTPPVLVYDNTGGIVDSPAVPTTGAGISTQQPLPFIPPGNIDLTAPVGTIDAGEAGVRSSGNINLAGAIIANGSQFSAGGKTTGIATAPTISASVAAAAGAAAGAATNAAQDISRPRTQAQEPSVIEVDVSVAPETDDEKRRRHHV